MALTKTGAAVDAWQEIAQNTVLEGTAVDISDAYDAVLYIDMALTSATAHTGTKISVEVSPEASGDEGWTPVTEFIGPTGTANTEASTANPLAAAATTGTVASTTGYDADETRWIFIEDATFANSELLKLVSHVSNTSLTWQDGTAREHANTAVFWNIAKRYVVQLPTSALRVRIVYDNTYDSDGSTVGVHAHVVETTAV